MKAVIIEIKMSMKICFIFCTYSFVGNPIFCVDIHPDGSRFATGGQGTYMLLIFNFLVVNQFSITRMSSLVRMSLEWFWTG